MPFNATTDLPWNQPLWGWAPFKIDALGLVTLLGSEEINSSLGRLVPSRYLEYLPLLGAFVIAGERFKDKRPSFNLYNITDGINTTELSFWLTRWMLEQEFDLTRNVVHFEVAEKPRSFLKWHLVAGSLSFVFTGFLMAMTILIGDWYGFANAIAMVLSIFTRAYSMQVHRNAIDHAVINATNKKGSMLEPDRKCLVIMSDSKAVTVYLPADLIIPVFVKNAEPLVPWAYHLVRYLGWIVFGVHIVTIGMATLLPQMYTVALLVIPTVLTCWKLGCDDSKWRLKFDRRVLRHQARPAEYECWIGTRLKAFVSEWPIDTEFEFHKDHDHPNGTWRRRPLDKMIPLKERSSRRIDLYAWLNLTSDEEESMGKWDLFPHVRNGNETWWNTYKAKKALIAGNPPDTTRKEPSAFVQTMSPDKKDDTSGNGSSPEIQFQRRRINTWLTPSGLVVPTPTASGFISAGMVALQPALDIENIPMRPTTGRKRDLSGSSLRGNKQ